MTTRPDGGPVPPATGPRRRARPVVAAVVAMVAALATALAVARPWEAGGVAVDVPVVALPEAAPPQAAPAPPSPPTATGPLLYEAAMDGTGAGFLDAPATELNPDEETLEHVPGAMRLTAVAEGAYGWARLAVAEGFTTYLAEMDVAVRPGSDVTLCWSLRWAEPRQLAWYWCLATASQTAEFRVFHDGRFTTIGSPVPVPGLQTAARCAYTSRWTSAGSRCTSTARSRRRSTTTRCRWTAPSPASSCRAGAAPERSRCGRCACGRCREADRGAGSVARCPFRSRPGGTARPTIEHIPTGGVS